MKNYLRIALLLLLGFMPFVLAAQAKVVERAIDPKDSSKVKFPVLKDYKLNFEVVSPERDFYAEEKIVCSLKLENKDSKKIVIYEWMMKEGDNIMLYYKPYDGKYEQFVEKEWKCLKPQVKENPRRSALQLNPNNSVFVEKELDLSKEVTQTELAKGGKKFYLIAVLNLNSLNMRTQPVVIKVK